MPPNPAARVRVGVSACLLGQQVRFDGGNKRNAFLVETLGRVVELVPVCPEVELGLGVPRETLRLERGVDEVRLIAPASETDHTVAMRAWARRRVNALARERLSGYVLKSNSPSCGVEGVPLYDASGAATPDGRGLFAQALIERFPRLPVVEEARLDDACVRENFVERVFAYDRLTRFFAERWTHGGLVAFHTRHKLELLTHSQRIYAALGRTVAEGRDRDRAELREEYETAFMTALEVVPTVARHVNVLHHIVGYFREHLDSDSRRELSALIDEYQHERVPLVVPLTLIRHYVRLFAIEYLKGQVYLEPHPQELIPLNHG